MTLQGARQYQLMLDMRKNTTTARELWKFIQYNRHRAAFSEITGSGKVLELFYNIISVPKDGNCFFTLELSNFSHETIQHLNLCLSAPITDLVSKLREVIVKEWLGCRRHLYQEFLPDYNGCQYEHWVSMFKRNYFYDCELL